MEMETKVLIGTVLMITLLNLIFVILMSSFMFISKRETSFLVALKLVAWSLILLIRYSQKSQIFLQSTETG